MYIGDSAIGAEWPPGGPKGPVLEPTSDGGRTPSSGSWRAPSKMGGAVTERTTG
jgi:hypothetical protein